MEMYGTACSQWCTASTPGPTIDDEFPGSDDSDLIVERRVLHSLPRGPSKYFPTDLCFLTQKDRGIPKQLGLLHVRCM